MELVILGKALLVPSCPNSLVLHRVVFLNFPKEFGVMNNNSPFYNFLYLKGSFSLCFLKISKLERSVFMNPFYLIYH